ncbi:hypothetical protein SAMD00019534_062060 [Acytostelium subglobosum LB1]|uniref:hypothetical protein n=1 Tax=Acytostelium subglobosum LB1 TaxID=1410327 RepID=UPI000645006C|nr:hypothetical protein SAMD00019534_062060 [Acytostelium subglobosum LB1]GAM23031.1 hypothetical protein SAMD00019534_062060 [Acytostelium subglobosum LB1]|eukprot:XP_012754258.1 hypothetical protein SAMD00019534_062060 [Acytostelium subglobosum LB1]
MDELEVLRQRLYSVQKEQSAQKLSERNCIEIISKMLELKMITIIHTTSGKEFITPKQLELEIRDEIMRSGGRVVVSDLQSLLNVDISYIQEKVNFIVSRDRSMKLYYGEIMTRYYLDSVVEEIHETLQEEGRLDINDLSLRFNLNSEILTEAVNTRLGKLIIGVFDNDILYTQAHVDRHKARVRGLFSSVTKPTNIAALCKQYQMNERLFRQQLTELIQEKRINGQVQGKGTQTEYIPTVFNQARTLWIDNFYKQNSYVPYSTLTKLDIPDAMAYLKNTYTNGVPLSSCFINEYIVNNVESSIEEIIASTGWMDISSLVPSSLSNRDIAMVIESCPTMKVKESPHAIVLNDYFIVSQAFVDRCFTLLEKMIEAKVEKQAILLDSIVTSQSTTATSTDTKKQASRDDLTSSGSGKGKGGGGGSGGKKSKQQEEQEQDDKPTKQSGKGGKKGGNKKGRRGDDSDDEDDYNPSPKQSTATSKKQQTKQVDHLPEIIQILTKSYENMEVELIQSLAQYLRPRVNQIWETLVKEAKEKLETETIKQRKGKQQELSSAFNSMYQNLLLFKKGMEELDADNSAMHKHLLKTVCTNLTNILLELNASYHLLENTASDTPAQRTAIISSLPSAIGKNMDKLLQSLNKSSIKDYMDTLDTVCEQSQIHLKPLDKKSEKALLESHQADLYAQAQNDPDMGNQFQAIVLLFYIKYRKNLVHVSPRSIGTLVQTLTEDESIADKDTLKTLSDAQQDVVKFIINKSENANDEESLKKKLEILKNVLHVPTSSSSTTTTSS